MAITNMAAFSKDLLKLEQDILKLSQKITDGQERKTALNAAGQTLVDSMVRKVPVSNKVVKRYSNGKVVATYYPGNLKRSIGILDFKDKNNVYVGVEIKPKGQGKGTFSGSNVDGWYAMYVEYGKRKNPFIRPAVDEVGSTVIRNMESFIERILNARS
jgi:HK97 gp10 family phage protein